MNIFFTSDTHFGHNNIIKLSNRPFSSVEEMNEGLIERWNDVVGAEDIVYHLGDFSLKNPKQYVERLNGKINLVFGNHDKDSRKKTDLFENSSEISEIEVGGQMIVLCHYAMKVWNKSHYGSWHLYGHSHGSLPDDVNSLSFDVGVDCWNYRPISFDEVADKMKEKRFVAVDHHRA